MGSFKISMTNGEMKILCEDKIPETDITDLLEFDESQMEYLYKKHAAVQAMWEQIAINLKNKQDLFVDNFEKKWWAHSKRFAKLVLQGYGEKSPPLDSIKDTVILIYSDEASDRERERYGEIAYEAAIASDASYKGAKKTFLKEMFKYLKGDLPWTYEALVNTSYTLERDALTVQNIAKRLHSRSGHMKDLKELLSA